MGKTYTNTHCCKKHNPNSWWYRERHPSVKIIEPASPVLTLKKTGFWNRLVNFIKRVFKKE